MWPWLIGVVAALFIIGVMIAPRPAVSSSADTPTDPVQAVSRTPTSPTTVGSAGQQDAQFRDWLRSSQVNYVVYDHELPQLAQAICMSAKAGVTTRESMQILLKSHVVATEVDAASFVMGAVDVYCDDQLDKTIAGLGG